MGLRLCAPSNIIQRWDALEQDDLADCDFEWLLASRRIKSNPGKAEYTVESSSACIPNCQRALRYPVWCVEESMQIESTTPSQLKRRMLATQGYSYTNQMPHSLSHPLAEGFRPFCQNEDIFHILTIPSLLCQQH
jgi:hypothetical protein